MMPQDNGLTISVVGGQGQGSVTNQLFLLPLQVSVTDPFGNPVQGASVVFSGLAGTTGANIVSPQEPTVLTDGNGMAALVVQANLIPGSFQVQANLVPSSLPVTVSPVSSADSLTTYFNLQIISKFTELAPTLPWSLNMSPDFSSGAVFGDIDLDGRCELISPNVNCTNFNLLGAFSFFRYGDLLDVWSSPQDTGSLITQGCYANVPGSFSNTEWTPQLGDQYCSADLDGDGAIEILVINQFSNYIGVLKWVDAGLQTIWNALVPSGVPTSTAVGLANIGHPDQTTAAGDLVVIWDEAAGLQPAAIVYWTGGGLTSISTNMIFPINKLYTCVIAAQLAAGAKWIIAYDASNSLFTAYAWQAASSSFVSQGTSTIAAVGPPFWVCGDLDGDGLDEIITYYGTPAYSYLLYSDSSGLEAMSINNSFTFSPLGPPMPAVAAVLPILAAAPGQAAIVYWLPQHQNQVIVCLYRPEAGGLVVMNYTLSPIPASSSGNSPWTVQGTDKILAVDLDADGYQELALSNGCSFSIAKYGGAQVGMTVTGSTSMAISGWAPNLLAEAPPVTFASSEFTGVQAEIYQYVSCMITSGSAPNSNGSACSNGLGTPDVRSEYVNANAGNSFQAWATALNTLSRPNNWSEDDWVTVINTLYIELTGAAFCSEAASYQQSFIEDLYQQQTLDFIVAFDAFDPPPVPADGTTITSSQENIIDALLWGLAAAPIGPALQISLAIIASLYPTLMNSSSNTPATYTFTGSTQLTVFMDGIILSFKNLSTAAGTYWNTILSDVNMLPLCGQLLLQSWAANSYVPVAAAVATSTPNQIYCSQQLMQLVFQIAYWQNASVQAPYYCSGGPTYFSPPPPSSAYIVFTPGTGAGYNINCLCYGTDTNLGFPTTTLLDYLDQLGVLNDNLFFSASGWNQVAIPASSLFDISCGQEAALERS